MNSALFEILKSVMPLRLQLHFRRQQILTQREQAASIWPIDHHSATKKIGNAPVWPARKRFAFILMHDVESITADQCLQLAYLEKQHGFASSFNFTARKHENAIEPMAELRSQGFEIGVRGLSMRKGQTAKINRRLKKWDAVGFHCSGEHFNFDWVHRLNVEYDSSTFDTDPFENAAKRMRTIFPFLVTGEKPGRGYIELPSTLPQDLTLFILMKEPNIRIWEKKLDWIAQNKGMALLNIHPEYMRFPNQRSKSEQYPLAFYEEFLTYVKTRYAGEYWNAVPREIARYWRQRFGRNKIMKQPAGLAAKSYS
jgi:hypothetical protein